MEITTQSFKHCDLVTIQGRVDSATAPKMTEVFNAVNDKGVYKIVVDMSSIEFMSSAGFRALLAAQRNCKRYNRGELVLAMVPERIYEALDLTGFVPLFTLFDDVTSAVGHF